MELEDGIIFIIIGVAISISLIYLTQNIITTNQTILHEAQTLDLLLAKENYINQTWNTADGNIPIAYNKGNKYIAITTYQRTPKQICLAFLHELGHRIAFDYNDSTEETAIQYANQNSWRCETI